MSLFEVVFILVCGLVVLWALAVTLRSRLHWLHAKRDFDQTIARVHADQARLAEGLVPEFDAAGDRDDLKRRYLAGEDIPIRWHNPR